MRKKKIKIVFYVPFSIIILLIIFFLFFRENEFLRLSFLNVGQGDATLINFSNQKIILIDGGPDNLLLRRLGDELPFYKKKIDLIVISHFHLDHINGLVEVLRHFKVSYLVYGAYLEKFFPSELILQAAKEQGTKIIELEEKMTIPFSFNCYFSVYNFQSIYTQSDNNSLVTQLKCKNFNFLAAGDNELAAEKSLLEFPLDFSADIFKASHHGALNANSLEFLQLVNPNLMVISVGKDNHFGHPSEIVLNRARNLGIKIKRTDIEGTINILANIK
jgi:competence protein ComEC